MGLFLASKLTRLALGAAQTALAAGEAYRTGKKIEKRVREALRPQKEDVITMKKSTFAAILVFFAAIAGALTAAYMYLRRREASWMNMSSSCSVRISAMRNLRRKKPPQRTRRMTPRMTSRFKRGRSAASETEKRRNGLRAVPAFPICQKTLLFRPTALRTEPHAPAGAAVTPFFRNTLSLMPRSTQRNASSACTHPAAYALSYSTKEWDKI